MQIAISLALLPPDDDFLMMKSYAVPGVTLTSVLGTGGSCVAYRASFSATGDNSHDIKISSSSRSSNVNVNNSSSFVCKLFRRRGPAEDSYYREVAALDALKDVANVPKLVNDSVDVIETADSQHVVLLVTPVAIPVFPVRPAVRVSGRHLRQLVQVVRAAHERGLCHRDIKPENMFLTDDSESNLLLNDWGAAVVQDLENRQQYLWIGTVRYSPRVRGNHCPSRVDDLRCVVRSAFVLITGLVPPIPMGKTDKEEAVIELFWSNVMCEGTYWSQCLTLAEALDYETLGNMLASIIGNV